MVVAIPDEFKDLVEGSNYATVGTVMSNGQPQLTVVWYSYDGENLLINTARGRQKEKNMAARPVATLMIIDPKNPYRWLEIRGSVEMSEDGALDHINALAQAYAGKPTYYGGVAPAEMEAKETRVICKIIPTKIVSFNPMGG